VWMEVFNPPALDFCVVFFFLYQILCTACVCLLSIPLPCILQNPLSMPQVSRGHKSELPSLLWATFFIIYFTIKGCTIVI